MKKAPDQTPVEEVHKDEPQQKSVKKQIFVSLGVLLLIILTTVLVIMYGKGYRLFVQHGQPTVTHTGILNTSSDPTGAQVFIDGHLTTATNNSLNLTPGKYNVTIVKDGYLPWKKDFEIKDEVVSNATATLYPQAPSLQSISTFGIQSAIMDPTGTKLAFNIASNSAHINGIYVYDMTSRSFPILAGQSSTKQVVDDTTDKFSQAKIAWSPDGTQLLASIIETPGSSPTYYLLNANSFNQTPQDITAIYQNTITLWQQQRKDKQAAQVKSLKPAIQKFAKQNFRILSWSPDDNKILYQASESATMPVFQKPRLIGDNYLYEQRNLEKGAIYAYDMTEDYNTRILEAVDKICTINDQTCNCDEFTECTVPLTWLPDSSHLLYVNDKKINVVEDDGSNMTTLYAGPFVEHYVFPWPDGSKIVILTNLNSTSLPPTLYSIGLK
ncbi:MAG TPA: PEGA domain-containing protein [Candidatus Saccharimonadales bacterium]|nr:PEGA domain-containing protein [Candidatus Saccharimonadales bacterium]